MKKMIPIKEEDGVHKEWYEEAKEQTLGTLPDFLDHLMDDYDHDYGTICHALAAGGIATMWAMNEKPQGGITGFQAGAIMWEIISHWTYTGNKCGMRLQDFDNLLYPQYDHKFEKVITEGTWKKLKEVAAEKLLDSKHAHPDVVEHWKSIVDGIVPFGFIVKNDY